MSRANTSWAWVLFGLGFLYFFLPLVGTGVFSLRARANQLSLDAYASVLSDSRFHATFTFSLEMAALTIVASLTTLLPFVSPAIVLVFGLIKTYSRPPFLLVASPGLLVAG